MAQSISLLGADYPDVPAVQLPKTGGGTATFYDVNRTSGNCTSGTNISSGVWRLFKSGKIAVFSYYFETTAAISKGDTIATMPNDFSVGTEAANMQWNAKTPATYRLRVSANLLQADEAIPNGSACQGQIVFAIA